MDCRPHACAECTQKCFDIHRPDLFPQNFSFFKVMIGGYSTVLFIPPKFAHKLVAMVNQTTYLEDPNGRLWMVKLSILQGCLAFQQGWHEFIVDHSIEFGDFLVFKYIIGSHFLVQIFGKSGCEKINFSKHNNGSLCQWKTFQRIKPAPHQSLEGGRNHDPVGQSNVPSEDMDTGPNPTRKSSPKNIFETAMENGELEKEDLNILDMGLGENSLTIEEKPSCLGSKSVVMPVGYCCAKGLSAYGSSWSIPQTPAKISERALCRYPVDLEGNWHPGKELDVFQEHEAKDGSLSKDEAKPCKVEHHNDTGVLIDPTFCCLVPISRKSESWLELPTALPSSFMRRVVNGFGRKVVLLRDPMMRVWPVLYVENSNCTAFSSGWQAFANENNLEQRDVCEFRVVHETKDMIQVQIFRAQGE